MIGNERVTGIQTIFGVDPLLSESVVQTPDKALRIQLDVLRKQLETTSALSGLLIGYVTAFYAQVMGMSVYIQNHIQKTKASLVLAFLLR